MSYYEQLLKIESLIGHYDNASAKELKAMIGKDSALNREFLKKVKSLEWFSWMKTAHFFDVSQIQFDQNGYAVFWNALDYLERVSEQLEQNFQYGKELIEIIESVVQFSLKKRINNYHIWWYCVKITNNLPAKVIKESLTIEQFRSWLGVWADHSMGVDLTISDIGEKLLPKFLHDDYGPEYKYAETIIDIITQIKSGGNVRGITRREDAVLAWDSYWIRDAFKKHGQLVGKKCSLNVLYGLADRLKDALEFKQKNYYTNIELGDDVYQIWVSRIESKAGEIGFKEGVYKCVVKQYSQAQLKSVDRENDFWALHNTEPETELKRFDFTAANKDAMVSFIRKNLPAGIEWAKCDKFTQKLEGIFDGLYSDYSHIWFKSLASGGQEHASGAEEILTTILRDVLLAKCETSRQDGLKVLELFLSEKYQFPIFRRFVLLCADKYWADYSGLLDRLIELIPNVLEESDLEVELQDILLHHNSAFSPALKTKLKSLIDSVPAYYLEKGEKLSAYWQFKWLSPLRENPNFKALYEDAKQKAEPKDDKPYEPERSAFKGGVVSHKSPFSKDEISMKPIAELVRYLSEFKGADSWHGTFEGEPDKEGLAEALQGAVKDDPKKFTDEIGAFFSIDYFYLNRLFRGLKEAWNAGKEIDWESIFDFSVKYFGRGKDTILKEALQAQGEDSGKGKYIWIVENVVDLIADGCKDDNRAFDPKYFDSAEKIFELILPLLKGEKHPDTQRDALTYVLNNTLGRTVMAYVSFSLRMARATQQKQENWGRDKYERFLTIGIDAYIWFGCYLPQMKYLDERYTKEKIEYFAQKDTSDFEWQMFMEGYLTGARIYNDLYHLMRENYAKGLSGKIFEERVDQKLVEHSCIGYLHLGELLNPKNNDGKDSLFWKMLTEAGKLGKRDRWLEVAGFFWSITGRTTRKEDQDKEEKLSEENKQKILQFWAWTFNNPDIAKSNLAEDYNSFLGRMAELTILLDRIDEEKEKWLLLSAPYIELQHRSTFFIEYLTKFDDQESIKRIGRIYKKVLENTTPTFRQEDIELIVRRVYEKGDRNDAEDICNTYGRRGVHFLKPVWEENQKKK